MKKKIIVPTDFSTTSRNAYLYARELAKEMGAKIEVIYVHTMTDRDKNVNFPQKMEEMKKELADFISLYPQESQGGTSVITNVEVETAVFIGMTVKSILHACQSPATTMYVMGMTGSHNAVGRYLGTISSAIARKAKCPVLLIPKGVKYQSIKNVLFASNYESATRPKLKQVTRFAAFFKAGIHFIHVRGKEEIEEFTDTEERIFERLFEEGDPTFRFNLTSIEAQSISEGINKYAGENNIDLVTLVNSRKGFFKMLFNKSITKKLAFSTKLPLLVLHLAK
jgi:Universal stress protein UspA and related nucleotide-binding proteins